MNQWSIQRKRVILSIIVLALVILVGLPLFFLFYPLLYPTPSCFDGKKNENETGIDCGGSCQLVCTYQTLPILSKGDPRVFELRSGIYEVVAIFDNPNVSAGIIRARYTLHLFEESSSIPVRNIESEVFVPNSGTFIVFEGPIDMGGRRPVRATLEWQTDTFVWQKNNEVVTKDLAVKNVALTREDSTPRISAMLENNSLNSISNIELTVLVSGDDSNLIAASKTFVENIVGGASLPIAFNWSEPFKIKEYICSSPVDVALVIDRSGSMNSLGGNPPQPLTDVKNTARYFTDQLKKNDFYALISFANEASKPIDATLGVDLETIQRAIDKISIVTTGPQNTNIGEAILVGREELNSVRHRENADKALVLLTDGVPTLPTKVGEKNFPETYALESAELARQDGISIYTIGLGKDVDMNLLRGLSTTTNDAYFAPSTEELNNIYTQIAANICKRTPAVIDIYMKIFPDRSFLK